MKKGRGAELYQRIIEFNEAAKSPTQVAKMHALGNTVYYGIKPNKHFFDDFIAYLKRDFARRPIILSQQMVHKQQKNLQTKSLRDLTPLILPLEKTSLSVSSLNFILLSSKSFLNLFFK